jgi:mannose-6-phosphate isomerase-like protein (cupin superfamily)
MIGDRVTFLKTATETQGASTLVQVELAPHGGNVLHYHLTFTERFEAIDGDLHVDLNGQHLVLSPGQSALVPIKAIHRFYNPSDKPVTFIVEMQPSRHFEEGLRIGYGLARDGKCSDKGIPMNLWHLAVLYQLAETYLPGIPLPLQKSIFGILAVIARQIGVEKQLRETYL